LIDVGTLQGNSGLVHFQRHGQKLLLVQENPQFHAGDTATALGRAVGRAFAGAVVGSFPVIAEEDDRVLIDATDFFLRDAPEVTGSLRAYDQASYRLDRERSTIYGLVQEGRRADALARLGEARAISRRAGMKAELAEIDATMRTMAK
jgi:hypothetical protein